MTTLYTRRSTDRKAIADELKRLSGQTVTIILPDGTELSLKDTANEPERVDIYA